MYRAGHYSPAQGVWEESINRKSQISKLVKRGDLSAAISQAKTWISSEPENWTAWATFGDCLTIARAFAPALDCYKRAYSLSPGDLLQAKLALAFAQVGDMKMALGHAKRLAAKKNLQAADLSAVAKTFTLAGLHSQAWQFAKRAVETLPGDTTLLFNAALAARACGKMDIAIDYLEKLLASNPRDWQAVKTRSDLKEWGEDNNHLRDLVEMLPSEEDDPDGFILVSAALAKENWDVGAYDVAFDYTAKAARARRRQINYSATTDISIMAEIRKYHDAKFLSQAQSNSALQQVPIFLLGLPRAGSTLLERVLAASSDVAAMGELHDFPRAYMRQINAVKRGGRHKSAIQISTDIDFGKLREDYLQSVAARGVETRYFVGKLPMNFLNVGLILRAIPEAKIVHIFKKPMDACFSIFRTFFGDGHPYSYDLEELASYYGSYRELMRHWRSEVSEHSLFDVSYEDFVSSPDKGGRKVFDFLGLAWSTDHLSVNDKGINTDTASAAQVRSAINTKSVGAYELVEKQLLPLKARLTELGALDPSH